MILKINEVDVKGNAQKLVEEINKTQRTRN